MKISRDFRIQKTARELSRDLRKNQTYAERILWEQIRKCKIYNYKFLRQHPIFFTYNGYLRFFIADFYCHKLRLIIEVDGPVHLDQPEYDRRRTELLESKNIRIIGLVMRQYLKVRKKL